MVPLYETLVADSVLDLDRALLDSMRAKIHDELANLDEKWLSLPLYLPCLWTLIRDFGLIIKEMIKKKIKLNSSCKSRIRQK